MSLVFLLILLGYGASYSDTNGQRLEFHEYPIYKDKSGATPPSIDVLSGLPGPIENILHELGKQSDFTVSEINRFSPRLKIQPIDSGEGKAKGYSLFLNGKLVLEGIQRIGKWETNGTHFLLALEMREVKANRVTKIVHDFGLFDWNSADHGESYPALMDDGLLTLDLAHKIESGNDSVEFIVADNGRSVHRIKAYDPVRGPIRNLFALNNKWYLQLNDTLIENGKSLNEAHGFEDVFNGRVFANAVFYLAKKGNTYNTYYGGKRIGKTYDYVPHDYCCGNSVMNVINGDHKIGLFGIRKGMWYLAIISK